MYLKHHVTYVHKILYIHIIEEYEVETVTHVLSVNLYILLSEIGDEQIRDEQR